MSRVKSYLGGEKLHGDDFSPDQIRAWYDAEQEGYANLGANDSQSYRYAYHELNRCHGFPALAGRNFDHALGLGSAYGDEFLPISSQIERLTIIDPSDAFVRDEVHGVPCNYLKPDVSGALPFPDSTFDLATSFGVLHHIPNVSFVLSEIARCLSPRGIFLTREPIVSMGDWTKPRNGLTKNERGIPLPLFDEMILNAKLKVEKRILFGFPPVRILFSRLGKSVYGSRFGTRLDKSLAFVTSWNWRYHPRNFFDYFRPTSVYYVLSKPL